MQTALINGRVLTSRGAIEECAVLVEGGRIADVVRRAHVPADAKTHDLGGRLLLPGFVDSQVNGGGGMLFGDNPTVEILRTIAQAHAGFGTTGFLPTLISGELKLVRAAIAAVDAAMEAGVPGIIGIHIEGPFLNRNRKGIHNAANFRPLDAEAFDVVTSFKRGRTLLTLAPEQTTPEMIGKLAAAGVIVAAGHTDATYAQARAALDHGLRGFTHLFNAMSPLRAREPGVVGAALDDAASWCGIIADGHHVHAATLRIALAAKGAAKLMLVTDAMPSVGAPTKSFVLQGQMITVRDGVCFAPDGTLAGSDLDMASAVRNAMSLMHVHLAEAVSMASRNPAAFLGLSDEMGTIGRGQRANFVVTDDALAVSQVWIDGRPV
ncbi:MAG: N-acetylglucosamine-6-phosphate deacetylase [Alphaproteobacteria bacterium]|nr:N-acetylglucosamine-6-phosphate deacetylase [Alphaproteobacteria bacterium]MBL6938493.1 N-acetylglucosamine-6-phosphate deacetylase [Alphaproteobacteria bacterium]MBL7096552.1 N-acetylglucosamine-6-phosphate deacetylase [Alphaproteobacteria bacterium]